MSLSIKCPFLFHPHIIRKKYWCGWLNIRENRIITYVYVRQSWVYHIILLTLQIALSSPTWNSVRQALRTLSLSNKFILDKPLNAPTPNAPMTISKDYRSTVNSDTLDIRDPPVLPKWQWLMIWNPFSIYSYLFFMIFPPCMLGGKGLLIPKERPIWRIYHCNFKYLP